MAAITHVAEGATSDQTDRQRFRSAVREIVPPDVLARQTRLAVMAFQRFPSRAMALLFLNNEDEALGGRPIDIAGASDAGADRASAALWSHSSSVAV